LFALGYFRPCSISATVINTDVKHDQAKKSTKKGADIAARPLRIWSLTGLEGQLCCNTKAAAQRVVGRREDVAAVEGGRTNRVTNQFRFVV
jgi:hypothetical protein